MNVDSGECKLSVASLRFQILNEKVFKQVERRIAAKAICPFVAPLPFLILPIRMGIFSVVPRPTSTGI